jgi:UDP-N-acetylmuramyl pentapeptide phosphotransferase/UDP-N-acetylglucosamine-1-phosphate transferase
VALVLAVALAGALAAALLVAHSLIRSPPAGLRIRNFRGKEVPVVGGVVVLVAILAGELVLAGARVLAPGTVTPGMIPVGALLGSSANAGLLLLALGFFCLGAVDDLLGRPAPEAEEETPSAKGLRGHAQALRRGVVTGGVVKAAGGAVLGLVVGALWEESPGAALLDGLLVALGANVLNLLDLRPGRAAKVFLLCAVSMLFFGVGPGPLPILSVAVVAVIVWLPVDLGEHAMLGDAGANLLGGVLAGVAALELGTPAKLAAVVVLALLTVASERWSFTSVIDRVPPLRFLDRLGRLPG